jgi:anti-anti-sigma factor
MTSDAGQGQTPRSRADAQLSRRAADVPPVVSLLGEFDIDTVPDLDRFLRRSLGPLYHRRDLVLDLSSATFIDSSFVAFVVRLTRDLRSSRSELVLARPRGQVRRVLGMVGLPNVIPVVESVEEADALLAGSGSIIPPAFSVAG